LVAPVRGLSLFLAYPRLAPWGAFLRRFAAQPPKFLPSCASAPGPGRPGLRVY